jgi:hypothetical protein
MIVLPGGQNYDEAVNYIKLKFSELNMNPENKTIYMHETCATDTNQVIAMCEYRYIMGEIRKKESRTIRQLNLSYH